MAQGISEFERAATFRTTRRGKVLYVLRRWPLIPLLVIGIVVFMAIFAPLLTGHDPRRGDLRDRLIPPDVVGRRHQRVSAGHG